MFTQSHYIAIVKVLKETNPKYDITRDEYKMFTKLEMWNRINDDLVILFEEDNDNFNKQKFIDALEEY